jgi:hypothetical protein
MLRTAFLTLTLTPGLLLPATPASAAAHQRRTAEVVKWITIQGTSEAARVLGYPGTAVQPAVVADGKVYILDFATPAERRQARKLNGQLVMVTGTLTGVEEFTTLCVPKPERLKIVRVQQLSAVPVACGTPAPAPLHGQLSLYRHIRFGRGAIAITVDGRRIWLDFGKHDDLYRQAGRAAVDQTPVYVTGHVRAGDDAFVVTGLKPERPRWWDGVQLMGARG